MDWFSAAIIGYAVGVISTVVLVNIGMAMKERR